MKSLHLKLLAVLGACLCAVGALFFFIQGRSFDLYQAALNQSLNEELAVNLVADRLSGASAAGDPVAAARKTFTELMAVNPGIEIYLLDEAGGIQAFTAPPDQVLRKQVDLGPVTAFIKGGEVYPILGDDPKKLRGRWIFSAAPLDPLHAERGILYVLLRGPEYEAVARRMSGGRIYRDGLVVMAGGLGAAALLSIALMLNVSRRLRHLTDTMEHFQHSDFTDGVPVPEGAGADGDEIDRLSRAYNAMADHIRHQFDELQRTDLMRRDLIASVSHDLRTPLASLRGYLETLLLKERSLTSEERLTYLQIAVRQSEQLQTLITELFDLVKLEGGETRMNPEPFQLSELVQDVVQKFELSAQQNGIDLDGQIAPSAPFVYGDVALIERVFANILDNAIRHTPAGGRISLKVSAKRDAVAVEIRDTGMGIPSGDIPHIFDRFYRVDKSRNQDSGGAGLGLAIVKRIIDMHSGKIDVSSRPGAGTCFTIRLPVAPHFGRGTDIRLAN